jgi:ABC-type bacteriocin/lantibiotic exporter with double-glycine peptidase domain
MDPEFFFKQRQSSLDSFLAELSHDRPAPNNGHEASSSENSSTVSFIRFLFKILDQEPIDKYSEHPNILIALQQNDIAYRMVSTNSINLSSDFGVIVGLNKLSRKPFAVYRKDRNIYLYDTASSLQQIALKNEVIYSKFADSMDMCIQLFGQLPWKVEGLGSLISFIFYGLKSELILILLTTLVIAFVQLLIPVFTSAVFSQIVPASDFGYLYVLIAVTLPITLSVIAATFTRSRLLTQVQTAVDFRLQAALVNRVLRQPLAFLQKYSIFDFVLRLMGLNRIREGLSTTVLVSMLGLIFGLLNLALMLFYQLNLTLVVIVCYLVSSSIFYRVSRVQAKLSSDVLVSNANVLDSTALLLDSLPQIRSTATEIFFLERWANEIRKQSQSAFSKQTFSDGLQLLASSTYQLTLVIILFVVSYDYTRFIYLGPAFSFSGLFPYDPSIAGSFLAFVAAFIAFNKYYESFVVAITDNLITNIAQWERSSSIIFEEPEIGYKPGLLSIVPSGHIQFSNVSFSLLGNTILENLVLSIDPGENIGITGPTGSGKSTIMRLISGVYLPDSGSVLINGIPLERINLKSLRSSIGIVTQNTVLPSTTVKDFISPSSSYAESAIWEALELACIADEINEMPMKLNTHLSEGGSNISGGQRQRIIIAKALIKKPRLLLLDEASSALSEKMQAKLTQNISTLRITSVSITHRVSTLKFCNCIHILFNGRIAQSGTYDDLLSTNAYFKGVASH